VATLAKELAAPSRTALNALSVEQREKEESARIVRQRPLLRISSELALVGILSDGPGRSGGELIMKAVRELVRLYGIAFPATDASIAGQRSDTWILAVIHHFPQRLFQAVLGDNPVVLVDQASWRRCPSWRPSIDCCTRRSKRGTEWRGCTK
jgi:hypothetical protein